jgi:hypothetical protein
MASSEPARGPAQWESAKAAVPEEQVLRAAVSAGSALAQIRVSSHEKFATALDRGSYPSPSMLKTPKELIKVAPYRFNN